MTVLIAAVLVLSMSAPHAAAQVTTESEAINPLRPADTSSPRATLRSFLDHAGSVVTHLRTEGHGLQSYRAFLGALETLDLGESAYGASWFDHVMQVALLKEILDRVELPPDREVPGSSEVLDGTVATWSIPGTRITIARKESGRRAGEFLFSTDTLARLDYFYRQARHLPYQPGATSGFLEALVEANRAGWITGAEVRMRLKGGNTSSPRATFEGFLHNVNQAYELVIEADAALNSSPPTMTIEEALEVERQAGVMLGRAADTLDLSGVPEAQRSDVAVEITLQLKEVLDRMVLPPIESIPDEYSVAARRAQGNTIPIRWQLPNTKIEIVEITEGEQAGEFLFSSATVALIEDHFKKMKDIPYRPTITGVMSVEYGSSQLSEGFYDFYISTPGYLIPGTTFLGRLIDDLPSSLKAVHAGHTGWQWVGLILCVLALLIIGFFVYHIVRTLAARADGTVGHWTRVLAPLSIAYLVGLGFDFADNDLNVTGDIRVAISIVSNTAVLLLLAWAAWAAFIAIAETIIASRKIGKQGIDASLLRIIARVLAITAGIWIVVDGLQNLGADLIPLLAGLGVGGLAVALAVRPTLENLIGGLILYADKPIRVGDYCSFGGRSGTIEAIGLRSTRIRGLDRTVASVPNATFADMEIINWAQCDRMLITGTIGLRYETKPDQLRYVLAKMREMFHAHPKIDRETVRVRFSGYGASSLDVTIRVYALTREWNEFHAIREDIYLRIYDLVEQSGTGFAFPSQTLYLGRDDGLDQERSDMAMQEVQSWRRSGRLPFPRLSADRMDRLEGTLDYPPRGSVDVGAPEAAEPLSTEPLSTEPLPSEPDDEENARDRKETEPAQR